MRLPGVKVRRRAAVLAAVAFTAAAALACRGKRPSTSPSTGSSVTDVRPSPPQPPGPLEQPDPRGDARAALAAAGGLAHLDALALLPFAEQRARAQLEDAALVGIDCFPVGEDGNAALGLVASGRCSYEFRSEAATRARPDLPVGVRTEARCLATLSVRRDDDSLSVSVSARPREECRRQHRVAPPRCGMADVWRRARSAGAPGGAVATIRFAARHRSAYDPVDAADDADAPERGLWQLRVERDDGPDFRFETWDDCGAAPATPEEKRIAAAVAALRPTLRGCFARAANRQEAVAAFELVYRLHAGRDGRTSIGYADTGVDVEGLFMGDLGQVRGTFERCARAAFSSVRLPAGVREVRLVARVERDGRPQLAPPPFD